MKYLLISILLMAGLKVMLPQPPAIIKGTVTDDDGHFLSFVAVTEKGNSNTVYTDSAGSFSITVTKPNALLIFSFPGFDIKELRAKSGETMAVQLIASGSKLEEVVVMGYAAESKQRVADLTVMAYSPQPGAPLIGRAAGVVVEKNKRRDGNNIRQQKMTEWDTEDYDAVKENVFLKAADNPLSTFSIDVDAASYSNMRRFLNNGELPPAGAIRVEEMINYFKFNYPGPLKTDEPFAVHTELGAAPWNPAHKLAMVHLQAKTIQAENLPASNLVFLIDVSGSMEDANKLPLVKQSMKLLTDQLREKDRVAMVVYAGNAGVVLPATSGFNKQTIKDAIDRLEAGGSTAGGAGIELAYRIARENFMKDGNNRVILCTDGDFNVGASSDAAMEKLIERERKSGVYLTVLGYGMGNYKDNKMQQLADKGNGNHVYIDNLSEAKKVLVHEFGGTLFTVAKDVKIQVEFNPANVQAYRLIGYENRMLNKEDFKDDTKDAGEMGSGHSVTALYEIIPVGVNSDFVKQADKLKYQSPQKIQPIYGAELMTVKFRYKQPDEEESRAATQAVVNDKGGVQNSIDFRFAAAVAEFSMLLSHSSFKQQASFENVLSLAQAALGDDTEGYRREFVTLVQKAGALAANNKKPAEDDVAGSW